METSRCENFLISDRLTSHFSFQLYATALSIDGENISYRPLRIGYADGGGGQDRRRKKSYIDNLLENVNSRLATGRNKRSSEDEIDVEGRVSYIAMEYIKFFTDKMRNRNLSQEETQSELAPLTHRSPPHQYSHCRLILSAGEKHCSAAAASLHWTWRPAPAADSLHLQLTSLLYC